jgi:hypothetical protein
VGRQHARFHFTLNRSNYSNPDVKGFYYVMLCAEL